MNTLHGAATSAWQGNGSHQPLDTAPHWTWRNPLNLILLVPLIGVALAVVGSAI